MAAQYIRDCGNKRKLFSICSFASQASRFSRLTCTRTGLGSQRAAKEMIPGWSSFGTWRRCSRRRLARETLSRRFCAKSTMTWSAWTRWDGPRTASRWRRPASIKSSSCGSSPTPPGRTRASEWKSRRTGAAQKHCAVTQVRISLPEMKHLLNDPICICSRYHRPSLVAARQMVGQLQRRQQHHCLGHVREVFDYLCLEGTHWYGEGRRVGPS